jgi:omega-6 fatty acid desaturase (delta-12 desaturase)
MTHDTVPRYLRVSLAAYQRPDHRRSLLELLVTIGPLATFWGLALLAARHGWLWAGAMLTVPAAAFLVRLFMIQHDCGHGAFFGRRAANAWTGRLAGVLTMTPYDYWRRTHAMHHATSGHLDRRGLGAVDTLTVEEFLALPGIKRFAYRAYRNPVVMFGLGPAYMFLLQHRLPIGLMKDPRAWLSIGGANLGLGLLLLLEIALAGALGALVIHLLIILMAATVGMWLFYVQHQFENGYWARAGTWTVHDAALRGSSHLIMPPVLCWLTANIGAHHIHHLGSRIPFYRLPEVIRNHPELRACGRMTLWESFRCARLALWDEAANRLTPFSVARRRMNGALT